jgi:hypothetical protein
VPHVRLPTLSAAGLLLAGGLVVLLAFSGSGAPGAGLASPSPSASPAPSTGVTPSSSVTASTPGAVAVESIGSTPATTASPASTAAPALPPIPPQAPTPAPTPLSTAASTPSTGAACSVFPSSNVWNRDISALPVAANSQTLLGSIGLGASLHPDFSATGYGIPINVVNASTPRVSVTFGYADESDPGPYPIPAAPLIEGGSDRHMLLWDKAACFLFELYAAASSGGAWTAGSGAIWDLRSNALRPDGWTSADAAGLPILPGLVRYDEVARGAILHALRFTAPRTRTAHIYPARHDAGESGSASLPPMGLRVRLKASVDIGGFGPQARVILTALQRYGMILADNGSPWYVTGAPDLRWNDDELHGLQQLTGADFEVVDTTTLR